MVYNKPVLVSYAPDELETLLFEPFACNSHNCIDIFGCTTHACSGSFDCNTNDCGRQDCQGSF